MFVLQSRCECMASTTADPNQTRMRYGTPLRKQMIGMACSLVEDSQNLFISLQRRSLEGLLPTKFSSPSHLAETRGKQARHHVSVVQVHSSGDDGIQKVRRPRCLTGLGQDRVQCSVQSIVRSILCWFFNSIISITNNPPGRQEITSRQTVSTFKREPI